MGANHGGDVSGPRPGTVDDEAAAETGVFPGFLVSRRDCLDAGITHFDVGDAVIGADIRAVFLGAFQGAPDQSPAVHRAVLDAKDSFGSGVQARFFAPGLTHGDFFTSHPGFQGRGQESVGEIFGVVGGQHEHSAGVFHGIGVDALDDGVFFGALGGGFRVRNHIASPRVQQPVVPRRGALPDVGAFQKYGAKPAHGTVAHHSRSGGAAADDHNICV